ncbi:MAG: hypothetical protein IPL81_06225 [Flavobacteriales bacterium]|nr:hypothetical protein [Flavobacteriales bacterium]
MKPHSAAVIVMLPPCCAGCMVTVSFFGSLSRCLFFSRQSSQTKRASTAMPPIKLPVPLSRNPGGSAVTSAVFSRMYSPFQPTMKPMRPCMASSAGFAPSPTITVRVVALIRPMPSLRFSS